MRISERYARAYILKPGDHQAGVDGDSVHMGKVHGGEFLFQFGSITGDAVLKFYVGATAGTKTTAIAYKYRLSGADQGSASADVFGDATAVVAADALTLTAATYDNRLLSIEFDSQAIADGTPWVTPEFSAAADALNVAGVFIGIPRDAGNDPATII